MIRIAGKIKSGLQLLVSKIKVYWRLFFQRMPLLRNATGIALLLFALFYWVRFDAPLNFQFSETGSHFQFIQESGLEDLYRSTASLELFDTAPIFIPLVGIMLLQYFLKSAFQVTLNLFHSNRSLRLKNRSS
jgi:hypothetical protein